MSLDAFLALLGIVLVNAGGFLYYLENQARSGLIIPCHRCPPGRYSWPGFVCLAAGIACLTWAAWPLIRIVGGILFR